MFLKIIINFDNSFKKKIDTVFPYFIRFFSKNRIKIFLDLVICWFKLLLKLLRILKISNTFVPVFSKKLYGFSVFYKVFSNNRMKKFLKVIINFYKVLKTVSKYC